MQPEKVKEVRAWFRKATNDLRGADIDLAASPPLIEDALFHCQQAVEKSLKGFLTAHDCPYRKTHDLDELGKACETIDDSLTATLTPARDLTIFAWEFRYPGDSEVPSVVEARQALATAQAAYDALLTRLQQDCRP